MPKGIPNGEPEQMLDMVEDRRHRREVEAMLDRMPQDTIGGQAMRAALRRALVGSTRAKPRLKPLARVPQPSDNGTTKRGT